MATPILEVKNLVKDYPNTRAVNGVSFDIQAGECFGLLGPNGAGKTTTLEIIEGITEPTSGDICYRGGPVGVQFRQEAGFLFQSTALQEYLTVHETLKLFSSLYERTADLEEIIRVCSLEPLLERDNQKLSGGQRQRMLLGISMINDPRVLFLDEPTTGLDPQSRRNFWELIESIRAKGKTIVLTTHYMEEAELLCDRIAIMDKGEILELDTTEALLKNHFEDVVLQLPVEDFTLQQGDSGIEYTTVNDHVIIRSTNVHDTIITLNQHNINLANLEIRNRNLEDLFLKLTGRELRT